MPARWFITMSEFDFILFLSFPFVNLISKLKSFIKKDCLKVKSIGKATIEPLMFYSTERGSNQPIQEKPLCWVDEYTLIYVFFS